MTEYYFKNLLGGHDIKGYRLSDVYSENDFNNLWDEGYGIDFQQYASSFMGCIYYTTGSSIIGTGHFRPSNFVSRDICIFDNNRVGLKSTLRTDSGDYKLYATEQSYSGMIMAFQTGDPPELRIYRHNKILFNYPADMTGRVQYPGFYAWNPKTQYVEQVLVYSDYDSWLPPLATPTPTVPASSNNIFTPHQNPDGTPASGHSAWAGSPGYHYGGPPASGRFSQGLAPASEPIALPTLPAISAGDSGLINMYKMSTSQLNALADYMWSPLWSVDTFKKILANPMDCILGLSMVPDVTAQGGSGAASGTVHLGNIDTGVSASPMGQYAHVNMGSVQINEHFGSFLDYAPYTELSIYLPFIGVRELNVDDFMGGTLEVHYYLDLLAGQCVACIVGKTGGVVASYSGACAVGIPVTANNWGDLIQGALRIAASTVGGGVAGAAAGGVGGAVAGAATGLISSTTANVMALKPHYDRGNSIGGSAGFLAPQQCYVIRTTPCIYNPDGYGHHLGYCTALGTQLGQVRGFTQVSSVHLDFAAPADCLAEIEQLLKQGVIM